MQSIGHDLRRGLNNINPLGNNYKVINKWLAEMKNIDSSLKTLDKEISSDAKLIAAWGVNEGDDLADVCQRMAQLMEEVGLIQQQFSLRHTSYRKIIKSIKVNEMALDENRKKKHDLTNQIAKLQKSSKENPIKLMELQSALERVSAELLAQELELMQTKRISIKDAFNTKFDSMIEYAEKMALIAGYGRQITQVIDVETQTADRMRIYTGAERTAAVVSQVKSAVTGWQPQPPGAPIQSRFGPSLDELALSAAASAYNRTPPMDHSQRPPHFNTVTDHSREHSSDETPSRTAPTASSAAYAAEANHASGEEENTPKDTGYVVPPNLHRQPIDHLQEQQRQLELEQQRLYQQNLASMSPGLSSSQEHYQAAAAAARPTSGSGGGNFTPNAPRRSETLEMYPPHMVQSGYESGSNGTPGYSGGSGNGQYPSQYARYESGTYQTATSPTTARPYTLGFVHPQNLAQMEADRHKAEIQGGGMLPPLQFSQSPILHEK
ncbi:hypothetical protein BGZ94_009864 [Podila epigama]|nr:hypothetical protein BGZ94_009864 [Podila epigama]